MIIINNTKELVIVDRLMIADTFNRRLRGLLGTSYLPPGRGLLISPCCTIHTFGMRYPIDVLFIDRGFRVQKIIPALPSGRLAGSFGSKYVLELPAGTVTGRLVEPGDELSLAGS